MSFSSRMQELSQRLLSTYGQQVSISREIESAYSTDTGECIATSTITYIGYGNPDTYDILELLNTNILETDIKLYFYSSTVPKVGDTLDWNNINYRIQHIEITSAQGNDCLYELQLRVV